MRTELIDYGWGKPCESFEVVIHHNDADGYCAAGLISVYRRFAAGPLGQTLFVEAAYGKENEILSKLPSIVGELMGEERVSRVSRLYIVDFSLPCEILEALAKQLGNPVVIYLDHHATAKQMLEDWARSNYTSFSGESSATIYADKRSGCRLTMDYILKEIEAEDVFCKSCGETSRVKDVLRKAGKIVYYCNDYDLWTHSDPASMHFVTGISLENPSVREWENLLCCGDTKYYETMGSALIKQQKKFAGDYVSNRRPEHEKYLHYDGHKIAVLNIPFSWTNIVSDEILKLGAADAVLSYCINGIHDGVKISMRSAQKEGCINCGKLMEQYFHGGGHINAAGGRSPSYECFLRVLRSWEILGRKYEPEKPV